LSIVFDKKTLNCRFDAHEKIILTFIFYLNINCSRKTIILNDNDENIKKFLLIPLYLRINK